MNHPGTFSKPQKIDGAIFGSEASRSEFAPRVGGHDRFSEIANCLVSRCQAGNQVRRLWSDLLDGQWHADNASRGREDCLRWDLQEFCDRGTNALAVSNTCGTGGAIGIPRIHDESTNAAPRSTQELPPDLDGRGEHTIAGEQCGSGRAGNTFDERQVGAAAGLDAS